MTSNETHYQNEFLYSVLNLPTSASQNEIRERYRSLSVIFHPDKQHDERTKDTASKEFLEIQKAYAVLSDPFLREVYDTLGEEGLHKQWPAALRLKSPDEIRATLKESKATLKQAKLDLLIRPRGSVTCAIDASSLFARGDDLDSHSRRLLHRLSGVGVSGFGVRHGVQKRVGEKTVVGLSGHLERGAQTSLDQGALMGTVSHQFSPRLHFETSAALFSPRILIARGTYSDNESTLSVATHFVPEYWYIFPPPTTVSYTRRLFRHSPTEGSITWNKTGDQVGFIEINVHSPEPFDFTPSEDFVLKTDNMNADMDNQPGSISGFGVGAHSWSYGVTVAGLSSCLKAEWAVTFFELALQLKAGIELGFAGAAYMLTGVWTNQQGAIATSVGLSTQGVLMRLELKYMHQKWTLPITLSPEYDEALALYSVVVPSTALILGYHFILKPRRRSQRAQYFLAAQRALEEEKSELRREIESTTMLLKETAKRHMQLERSRGGLIILEASYGPTCPDDEAKQLNLDVTVPVQALVHNSQVYVPGHRTKSGIQGFYDPAPTSPKSLRVRYLFRDQLHYAEIPDYIPVVLPLKDHLVN
ncbi:DnaJ-domain-containing protein [Leucogyrophana mollusca]|uniref:DnaJ-domain-containing protein n=1 Tax=Leucogyrophana mollusca TaxID=85980 RepID=A0ACB8BK55_9AGAM|nr:DnaJ-domain-containing protein [Leucogyrophana mollusca]